MQTFLPYPSFSASAAALDYRRLGKQRVEAWQILMSLLGKADWPSPNHPGVKMWKGHLAALCTYGTAICEEWIRRGYRDSMLERFACSEPVQAPAWLGDPEFHAAHRSNLLRKDPVHYGRLGWTEPADMPYVWPKVAA